MDVADQNQFRNDNEVLEAIGKSQERMKEPEGFNFEETLKESLDSFHTERRLAYEFARVILDTAHLKDGWWSRLKLERSFKGLEDQIDHLQNCPRCKQVMGHAVKAIEYLKIVLSITPMIVTREDAEKAIKCLAEKNKMTEADFRNWMNETGDRVIKEMNKTD